VRVLEAEEESNALLLERCFPGTSLCEVSEEEQDVVIAGLLRRLWRTPSAPHPFRSLSLMLESWSTETLASLNSYPDTGLVREGLQLFQDLPRTGDIEVLLATDLHAGNVLRATREPWLVIDPKPFVGDPAFDATQHLLNCASRMRSEPRETIHRFADLLGVDHERVRLWMFARLGAGPRGDWNFDDIALARTLA
jgi:streptomycin 6-kinase